MPLFKQGIEAHWITVTNLKKAGADSKLDGSSSICGEAKYFCISAPGTGINSTIFEGGGKKPDTAAYGKKLGTSMAAPHVAGGLAILMERYPYMTNSQVRDVILTTAARNSNMGSDAGVPDRIYGWGNMDLAKAINGPGQFFGHFAAGLPKGMVDTWSNDISDKAIRARKSDDIADIDRLKKRLKGGKWDDGKALSAKEKTALKQIVDDHTQAAASRGSDPLTSNTYVGSLEKLGDGELKLTGKNTYSGSTWVRGGKLSVDGSIASTVTVDNSGIGRPVEYYAPDGTKRVDQGTLGGILGGSGTIGGLVAKAGGTVAPGNSVGTLTDTGDARFEPGSELAIEVKADGSAADRLAVSGKAELLGGVVTVHPEGSAALLNEQEVDTLFSRRFDILTAAGGITGKFDEVKPTYEFVGAKLGYAAQTAITLAFYRNERPFVAATTTKNAAAVAGAIAASSAPGTAVYNTALFAPTGTAAPLFSALAGDVHATLGGVLAADTNIVDATISRRLSEAFDVGGGSGSRPLGFGSEPKNPMNRAKLALGIMVPDKNRATAPAFAWWGEVYGSRADQEGDGNVSGIGRDAGGLVTGVDAPFADTWRLGLLVGYANTSVSSSPSSAWAKAHSYQFGLYGGARFEAVGVDFGAIYAHHEVETGRTTPLAGVTSRNVARYDADSMHLFGEASYRFDTPVARIKPFAGMGWTYIDSGSFAESGGLAALSGEAESFDLATTTVGLRLERGFTFGDRIVLTARGMVGWNHALGDVTPAARLAFALGGDAFSVKGLPVARDTLALNAALDLDLGSKASLGLAYQGQIARNASDHAVKASLTVRF